MKRLTLLTLALCMLIARSGQSTGGSLSLLQETGTLRFCADPKNLPFSSDEPQQPGFEVELGREVAREFGLQAAFVWIRTESGRTALRQLLEGRCELFMGLPQDQRFADEHPRLTLSRPYYTMSHVLVLPEGTAIREVKDLGDKPVAVEFGSLGELFAFQQGAIRQTHRQQEDIFQAVSKGGAAAAIMWAPIAGWLAHRSPASKLRLVALPGSNLAFPIAMGMRQTDTDLKAAVDGALVRLEQRQVVAEILTRYGVPTAPRVAENEPARAAAATPANSGTGEGERLFKRSCVECHGAHAKGSTIAPNLTIFKGMDSDFVKVVLNGRPTTAMTPFKGLLTEEEVRQIHAYIKTLPK